MASKNVIDKLMLNGNAYYTANDGELNIKLNGTSIGTFNANEEQDKEVNIAVSKSTVWLSNVDNTSDVNKPVSTAQQAALDEKQDTLTPGTWITITNNTIATTALPGTTKYGASLDLTIDPTTYIVTATLKDQDGNALGTPKTIDLPLETVVVSGSYDSATKKIILTLENGNTIDVPVGDLVAGLQSEITSTNKLDADLVDDTTSSNKFVSASEKSTWNGKQDQLVSGTNIKTINNQDITGAGNINIDWGVTSVNSKTGAVVLNPDDLDDTNTTNKFVTAAEKTAWDNKADDSDIGNATITIKQAGVNMGSFTANQSTNWDLNIAGTKAVTQTEYNNLPASKTSDNNLHIVYKSVTA